MCLLVHLYISSLNNIRGLLHSANLLSSQISALFPIASAWFKRAVVVPADGVSVNDNKQAMGWGGGGGGGHWCIYK